MITAMILRKSLIKDHHLLLTLLTGDGEKITVLMMGGQGGKKTHSRSNILELGNIIQFVPVISKKGGFVQDLWQGKEWVLLWQHKKIRYDFKKFQVLTDWLMIMEKISLEASFEELKKSQNLDPLYLHISNAIVSLDQADVSEDAIRTLDQLKTFFLLRLCFILGVAPRIDECMMCLSPLTLESGERMLMVDAGGFVCADCQSLHRENHFDVWLSWKMSMLLNWKKIEHFKFDRMNIHYEMVRNYSSHHLSLTWKDSQSF
ncbi:MAG: hypothetical protein QE271_14850 [Bacteriovoracaceae bacterium]|nr:hypothetical protein [Bacteriovoracaceae bacterium]